MTDETKLLGEQETELASLVRLPLWKRCLESMLHDGVDYGKTYTAEYFEAALRCNRDEMQFGLAISEIRRALQTKGFHLSGRGLKGDSFIVLEPNRNADVMRSYSSMAIDALKRGVILGTNTRIDTLTDDERRKHESTLEKIATRLALVQRPMTFANMARKAGAKPKLLEK